MQALYFLYFCGMGTKAYELVVGLEVHAQLQTSTKLFCADPTAFGAEPNTQVSPVSLAHPGTLPRLNRNAIDMAVRFGLSMGCRIQRKNYFARKHYFYPDLPKGYQVSQLQDPICAGGGLHINSQDGEKWVQLHHIHLEEDAGKSLHDVLPDYSCIDLNRAGMPLLEIVTEPCIHSAEDAFLFLTKLRQRLRWTGVCDGNMEEGSMRCDANISVRPVGQEKLGTRVEVKNLNSIRNVRRAIEVEAQRLIGILESGQTVRQETRHFDALRADTIALRSKEEAEDYRYFPDPDLPPFTISDDQLEQIRVGMPVMPEELCRQWQESYGLPEYDASVISADKETADYYMALLSHTANAKAAANWVTGPLKQYSNEQQVGFDALPWKPALVADLIELTESGQVSFSNASTRLLKACLDHPGASATDLAKSLNLLQEKDEGILFTWVDEVLASMPEKVKEYKSGKKGLIGLFAGEVKKRSKGKADMQLVQKIITDKLSS